MSFRLSASLLSSNAILQSITATSPKPSFLLWEKAQRRTASAEEEMWLLRGLQAFVGKFDDKLAKDEALRFGVPVHRLAHSSH